jgi:Protein of unknown function (DUF3617)
MMRRILPAALMAWLAAAPAAALDLPTRKAGLWQITMSFEGRSLPPQTIEHCVDADTDKLMNSVSGSMRQDACSRQDMQKVGGTIVVDSVCKIANSTVTTHAVVSGDFNSAYTVKVTSKREGGTPVPGMPADGTSDMTLEGKWTGPCKADQKPGDVVMGGRKFNVQDLQKLKGAPK